MKPHASVWVAGVLGLLVLVLWMRLDGVQGELAELRAQIDASGAGVSAGTGRGDSTMGEDDPSRLAGGGERTDGASAVDEARILELERVVNGQADILERLLGQFATIAERERRASARPWGPEQAVGAPDTMSAGDHRTAWAPASADGGVEWIEAEFENPADVAQVMVRQTCNPGGVIKVMAVTDTGAEVPIWEGQDPSMGQELADTPFAAPAGIHAKRVRVYVDTSKRPGWEEIDAIQLVGRDGTRQWASSVNASSTYAGSGVTLNALGDVFSANHSGEMSGRAGLFWLEGR